MGKRPHVAQNQPVKLYRQSAKRKQRRHLTVTARQSWRTRWSHILAGTWARQLATSSN